MTKEHLKHYLRYNGLAYMTAEVLYENALYVPFVVRGHLSAVVRGLRTGGFSAPPGQSVITWDVPLPQYDRPGELVTWFRSGGVEVNEGAHTLYIPPQAALRRLIPSVVDFYPPHSGFKILKDFRDPLRARYIYKHPRSLRMLKTLIGAPRDQVIAANYMHAMGIGPRVWDICGWKARGKQCTVFVVDHVTGLQPSHEQCLAFLAHLTNLTGRSHLRILVPRWRQSMDFQPPDCNHNLLYSETLGRVQYVDFQNFGLRERGVWWRETAAARKPENALFPISRALRNAAIEVRGRLVLDVGCGDGMRLHAALAHGASWGIGWDGPDAVHRTSARLLSHGSTRFSLIAAEVNERRQLADDVPAGLRPLLPRAVVFCPASRGHLDLLASVFAIPWSVLVCEGDASEGPDEITSRLQALARSDRSGSLEVVTASRIPAESGAPRPLVIVRRPDVGESFHRGLEPAG